MAPQHQDVTSPSPEYGVPNFTNSPHKLHPVAITVSSVGIVLSTICIIARMFTKLRTQRKLTPEYFCAIISWIFWMETQSVMLVTLKEVGGGMYPWEITAEQSSLYQKLGIAEMVGYIMALNFGKISLLFFYHRVCHDSKFRRAISALMFLIIVSSFILITVEIFACLPIERAWNFFHEGYCINKLVLRIVAIAISMVTDMAVLALPLLGLSKFTMRRAENGMLWIIPGCSFASIIATLASLLALTSLLETLDRTWNGVAPSVWLTVEGTSVIICACLPALPHFFCNNAPRWFGQISNFHHRFHHHHHHHDGRRNGLFTKNSSSSSSSSSSRRHAIAKTDTPFLHHDSSSSIALMTSQPSHPDPSRRIIPKTETGNIRHGLGLGLGPGVVSPGSEDPTTPPRLGNVVELTRPPSASIRRPRPSDGIIEVTTEWEVRSEYRGEQHQRPGGSFVHSAAAAASSSSSSSTTSSITSRPSEQTLVAAWE